MSLIQGLKLEQGEGIVGIGSCICGIRSDIDVEVDRKGYVVITTRRILFYDFDGWLKLKHHYSFEIPMSDVKAVHMEMWLHPQLVISFEKPRAAGTGFQGTVFDRDTTPRYLTAIIKRKIVIRHPINIRAAYNILKLII